MIVNTFSNDTISNGGGKAAKNETLKKILVLGSGAIKIGEAGESR